MRTNTVYLPKEELQPAPYEQERERERETYMYVHARVSTRTSYAAYVYVFILSFPSLARSLGPSFIPSRSHEIYAMTPVRMGTRSIRIVNLGGGAAAAVAAGRAALVNIQERRYTTIIACTPRTVAEEGRQR